MTDLEPLGPEPEGPQPEGIDEPEVLLPGESPRRRDPGLRPRGPREPEFQFRAPLVLRAIAAVLLAFGGLLSLAVGAILTLTVIGAWAGVPLLILGLALLILAGATLFGGGKFTVRRQARGRPDAGRQ